MSQPRGASAQTTDSPRFLARRIRHAALIRTLARRETAHARLIRDYSVPKSTRMEFSVGTAGDRSQDPLRCSGGGLHEAVRTGDSMIGLYSLGGHAPQNPRREL